jgi:hypothetical protein
MGNMCRRIRRIKSGRRRTPGGERERGDGDGYGYGDGEGEGGYVSFASACVCVCMWWLVGCAVNVHKLESRKNAVNLSWRSTCECRARACCFWGSKKTHSLFRRFPPTTQHDQEARSRLPVNARTLACASEWSGPTLPRLSTPLGLRESKHARAVVVLTLHLTSLGSSTRVAALRAHYRPHSMAATSRGAAHKKSTKDRCLRSRKLQTELRFWFRSSARPRK